MDISKKPILKRDKSKNDSSVEEEFNLGEDCKEVLTWLFFVYIRTGIKFCLWFKFGEFLWQSLGGESIGYIFATTIVSLLMYSCIFICPIAITTFTIVLDSNGKKILSIIYSSLLPFIVFLYPTANLDFLLGISIVSIFYSFLLTVYPQGTIIDLLEWDRIGFAALLLIVGVISFFGLFASYTQGIV